MDRENDIFEKSSKVQNMNFIFDDDDNTKDLSETQAFPASRRTRQVASDGTGVKRGRKVEGSGVSQRQRAARSSQGGQAHSGQKVRAAGAAHGSEAAAKTSRQTHSSAPQTRARKVEAVKTSDIKEAAPRKVREGAVKTPVQTEARQNRPIANTAQAKTARKVRPEDVQPRQAAPRQVRPEEAQPRKVNPKQVRATSSGRSVSARPDSERINRASASGNRARGRKEKKRSSGFKKFLLIYAAVLLVILVVGSIIFGSFLRNLEKSQPSNIASEVVENFAPNKVTAFLKDHSDSINCFGEPDDLIAEFASSIEGAEKLSYIENKDYRADSPSYNITADGKTVAKLTLEKNGSGSFGLSKWKIANLNITDYMETQTFEFLAPKGVMITINGVELDEKYATGEESIPENLKIASKYVEIPSFITYKVAGIAGDPEIKATDASGADLKITKTEDKYLIGSETSKKFIKSVKGLVQDAVEAWGKHFINMGGGLSSYMIEGSDWYSYIFGSEDMDPILTSLYEFESIANYEFTEKEVKNFIRVTDDCFTVDVHYKMRIDFNTDRMSDNNQQLDATWVFITQNGGQDWYIIDCIYK